MPWAYQTFLSIQEHVNCSVGMKFLLLTFTVVICCPVILKYANFSSGSSGLGGTTLLPPANARIMKDINAIVAMRDGLMSQPAQKAWLIATGPVTNAALLFATFPEVAEHIAGLSMMSGAVGGGFTDAANGKTKGLDPEKFGNETDWAEFNIYCIWFPEETEQNFEKKLMQIQVIQKPQDRSFPILS